MGGGEMKEIISCVAGKLSDGTILRFARVRSANEKTVGPAHNELAAVDTIDGALKELVMIKTAPVTLESSMQQYTDMAVKTIERELQKIEKKKFDPVPSVRCQVVEDFAQFAMALRRRPVRKEPY
jgi:hypothetical protein